MIWTIERQQTAKASLAKWHGTPHRNRIAMAGVGIDCIKLVLEVLIDSGVVPRCDFYGYNVDSGMWGVSTKLQDTFMRHLHCEWVEKDFEFGDIFIMKTGSRSAHCGFFTADGYVWHSLARRQVTKSDFVLWQREIIGMIRINGLGFKLHPSNGRFN